MNVNASQVDRLEVTHGSQLVLDGGAIGDRAKIVNGSVAALTGGVTIGRDFLISNSTVAIDDATIEWNMDVVDQSNVAVTNATLRQVDVADSTFEFSGGLVEYGIDAARSTIRVGGGVIERDIQLEEGSRLELSGGLIHWEMELTDSHAEITGGEWGRLEANQSSVNVDAPDAQLGSIKLRSSSSLDFRRGQLPLLEALEGSVANVYEGQIEELIDENASVTIHGGEINRLESQAGNSNSSGHLTIAGGRIVDFSLSRTNGATQTGGLVEEIYVKSGSQHRISGGAIGDHSRIYGQLRMTGGTIGRSNDASNGQFSLVGGEFELNGVPVTGLDSVGSSTTLQLVDGDLLSGVLQDGTPIALGGLRSLGTDLQNDHDIIRTVNLSRVGLPFAPPQISTGTEGVPRGARAGQTVTFTPGTMSEGRFRAGRSSQVIVQADSQLGDHLEAFGATIDVEGGTVGDGALVHDGATLNLNTGHVGEQLRVNTTGRVNIKGGTIADGLTADSSGLVVLSGNSFALDGVPLTGLVEGTTYYVGNLSGKRISGILEDGTPILLSDQYPSYAARDVFNPRRDRFGLNDTTNHNSAESLAIHIAPVAPLGPAQITASTDPIPYGIRGGQTITVDAGSQLPQDFNAGNGSRVEVLVGGSVGKNLEAVGARVEILGGTVGDFFEGWDGTEVLLDGGSIGRYAFFANGSRLEMRNGTVGDDLQVQAERFEMLDGTVGREAVIHAEQIMIGGGELGEEASLEGNITITAGRFPKVYLDTPPNTTDRLSISGGEFPGRANIRGSGEISGGHFGENSSFRGRDSNLGLLEIAGGYYAPGTTFDDYVRITGGEFANVILDDDVWVDGGLFFGTVIDGYGTVITDGIFEGETFFNSYSLIEGGMFERFHPRRAGIYGGEYETIILDRNGELGLYGDEFFLDGLPIVLNPEGEGLVIDAREGVLTGTLADGSDFSLELNQFLVPGEDFVSVEASLKVYFANPLGDYDDNGLVSGSDFLMWQKGDSPEDLSLLDLERWKRNYGSVTSSAPSVLVTPEPSAVVLGMLATFLGVTFRRNW